MDYETNFIEIIESRNMFEEILVNFYHKNYRSCIVSLNSLLYYDLMKKLEILKDNYNDKKSKDIIDEIDKMIKNDDKYSDTELKLLNLCKEKNLINSYFYEKSENLRKVRNHCAHPAFYTGELYIPSKREVAMYIDFIYNDLLKINAINYYDAVNFVLDDIKEAYNKGLGCENKGLKTRALRLYSKFDNKNRQKIFNSLFELSIIKNTDDCKKYRDYTYSYMLWLVEFCKNKNIMIDLDILKKINISHLDRDYFDSNQYMSQIIIDNIISLKDVEEYNSEIYELYKQFLYDSDNLYKMYEQLFNSFLEFVEYIISENPSWYKIAMVIKNLDIAKTKPYFYRLLKKLIEITPTSNGFDKSDFCIQLYVDNSSILSNAELDELLSIMLENNQFFNSAKRKNDENKDNISSIFGIPFSQKQEEINLSNYYDYFEPEFLK